MSTRPKLVTADHTSAPSQAPSPDELDLAERMILGAILLDDLAIVKTLDLLTPEDFSKPSTRTVYQAMLALLERAEPIDLVTLSHELTSTGHLALVGGSAALAEYIQDTPSAANIVSHCKILREHSLRRAMFRLSEDLLAKTTANTGNATTILADTHDKLLSLTSRQETRAFQVLGDALQSSLTVLDQQAQSPNYLTGIPTGFPALDQLTAGLQNTDLIILAARPAMGKTSLALSLARYAALDARKVVGIISLEMSLHQLVLRLLSTESAVDYHRLRSSQLTTEEWTRVTEAAHHLTPALLYIDDTGLSTLQRIRGKAYQLKQTVGLDLLIIDYLQLIQGTGRVESRQQAISDISRGLKLLAKELNIPILVLSQLSRAVESRRPPIPILADLRDSGSIEQDADLVWFLYREEVYDPQTPRRGLADLLIKKHRNGPVGDLILRFTQSITRFEPGSLPASP